jgi:hypothetical protein
MARGRRADNRKNGRHAFDTEVVRTAVCFCAVLWQPRGESIRHEFSDLPSAIEAAGTLRDPYGRQGLVYAVSASGRDAELSRADWPHWLAFWKEARK